MTRISAARLLLETGCVWGRHRRRFGEWAGLSGRRSSGCYRDLAPSVGSDGDRLVVIVTWPRRSAVTASVGRYIGQHQQSPEHQLSEAFHG